MNKKSNIELIKNVKPGGESRCQDQGLCSAGLEKGTGCMCLLMLSEAALCLHFF